MNDQIYSMRLFAQMPWHVKQEFAKRLSQETVTIRSLNGFLFECQRNDDNSIELFNFVSHVVTNSFESALSMIELIDRLNPPLARQKVLS
jgi:hypothetical protein